MDTETLKKIAEYMAWSPVSCMICDGVRTETMPNPLMDDSKTVELMEKMKIDVKPILNFWVASARGGFTSKGKTINEAVLNAASELVKDK